VNTYIIAVKYSKDGVDWMTDSFTVKAGSDAEALNISAWFADEYRYREVQNWCRIE